MSSDQRADQGETTLETAPALPPSGNAAGFLKKFLGLFFFALVAANIVIYFDNQPDEVVVPPPESAVDRSLLFLGDIYTAQNDLPALVGRLMEGASPSGETVWSGGHGGRGHMLMLHLTEALEGPLRVALPGASSRPYVDTLVLQPNANIPMQPTGNHYLSRTMEAAGGLDALWSLDGATTYLMLGWGWRDGWRTKDRGQLTDYIGMQQKMLEGTLFMSGGMSTPNRQIPILPVGMGWAHVYYDEEGNPGPGTPAVRFAELYEDDGMAPSLLGSVLAAYVIYVALTGRSCVGLDAPAEGVTAEQLAYLQGVADEAVFEPLVAEGTMPPLPALAGR